MTPAELRSPATMHVLPPAWADRRTLWLSYAIGELRFDEVIAFPGDVAPTPWTERATDLLAVVAGVSYYKTVMPGDVVVDPGVGLTESGRALAESIYDDGLRECALVNGLDVPVVTDLTVTAVAPLPPPADETGSGLLIPFGAGRDSTLVAAELAGLAPTLLTVGRNRFSVALADRLGVDLEIVDRTISPVLLELNEAGAQNGHVPVTAINSLVAAVASEPLGCDQIVMANERASSEPTRIVDGVEINHQFSKSAAFERGLDAALSEMGRPVRYYSALRPWGDAQIGSAFSRLDPTLQRSFVSCNRAYVRDPEARSPAWCGDCAKCRSVFLSLAPWMAPTELAEIFGSDLLAEHEQLAGFRELVTESDKPFECVSDTHESQSQLGRLLREPAWCDHVVVRGLAEFARADDLRPDRAGDDRSRIPPAVLSAMSERLDA